MLHRVSIFIEFASANIAILFIAQFRRWSLFHSLFTFSYAEIDLCPII